MKLETLKVMFSGGTLYLDYILTPRLDPSMFNAAEFVIPGESARHYCRGYNRAAAKFLEFGCRSSTNSTEIEFPKPNKFPNNVCFCVEEYCFFEEGNNLPVVEAHTFVYFDAEETQYLLGVRAMELTR